MTTVDRFDDNGRYLAHAMKQRKITTTLFLPSGPETLTAADYAVITDRGPKLPYHTPDEALASAAYFVEFDSNLGMSRTELDVVREKLASRLVSFGFDEKVVRKALRPEAIQEKQKAASLDDVLESFSRMSLKEKRAFIGRCAKDNVSMPDELVKEAALSQAMPLCGGDCTSAVLERQGLLGEYISQAKLDELHAKLSKQDFLGQVKTLTEFDFKHGISERYSNGQLRLPEDAIPIPVLEKRAEKMVTLANGTTISAADIASRLVKRKEKLASAGFTDGAINALSSRFDHVYPSLPTPLKTKFDHIITK